MGALTHSSLLDHLLGILFLIGFGALFLATFKTHWLEFKADFRAWQEKRRLKKLLAPSKKGLHK